MSYERYPLTMYHPNGLRGSLQPLGDRPRDGYQGTPDRLPPIIVHNDDQEAQYAAKGYVSNADPKAYEAAMVSYEPNYEPEQYPKYLGKFPDGRDMIARDEDEEMMLVGVHKDALVARAPEKVVRASKGGRKRVMSAESRALLSEKMKAIRAAKKAAQDFQSP